MNNDKKDISLSPDTLDLLKSVRAKFKTENYDETINILVNYVENNSLLAVLDLLADIKGALEEIQKSMVDKANMSYSQKSQKESVSVESEHGIQIPPGDRPDWHKILRSEMSELKQYLRNEIMNATYKVKDEIRGEPVYRFMRDFERNDDPFNGGPDTSGSNGPGTIR